MTTGGLWRQAGVEPSVAELLEDSAAQILLRYDGLAVEQVWSVVEEARARMVLSSIGPKKPGREAA